MVDNFKVGSDYNYDGTVEYDEGVPYLIFGLLLAVMVGAFLGSIIASSATVASVNEHYCTRYADTQKYIAC